jgi:hypothetical protein
MVENHLAFFHHEIYNFPMKQVEKDRLVQGVLIDELNRSREMVRLLEGEAAAFPRGSLHVRRKAYKDHSYEYHYLKRWEDGKSVSVHIPRADLDRIKEGLERRKAYKNEISEYKGRIRYLERILKV